jgi:multiple sugar transport system permease protein
MKKKSKFGVGLLIVHILMFALAVFWLYPYLWMIVASFKPDAKVMTTALWQGPFTFDNYKFIIESSKIVHMSFFRSLFNSIWVTFVATFFVVVFSSIVAYAFSKLEFPGKRFVNKFLIFQMVFPTFMFMVPQFILMRYFNLLNTYSSLFLPYVVSISGIFLITQSFRSTPNDYIEAAKIDGASNIWIVFKLMMPLNKAIITIIALNVFVGVWNDFMWPLIVTTDYDKMTLAVLLATFFRSFGNYIGAIMAGSTILTLPMIVGFIVFRKYLFEGMNLSLK